MHPPSEEKNTTEAAPASTGTNKENSKKETEESIVPERPSSSAYSRIKKTSKIPSLQELAHQAQQQETKENTAVVEEPVYKNESRDETFGLQDLKKYWQDFADKKKLEGKSTEYILLNEDISLLEDHTIEIKLSNPLQEETLNTIKPEVLLFLREKLKNDSITIKSIFNTEERKRRLYTTREKFDHLAQKHPILQELKDRLGLDSDF